MFKLPKNQAGILHILPLLVIIAAIGLISFLLLSSTAPFSNGLFSTLFPRSSSNAAADGFLETFAYGAYSSPTAFKSPRWIVGYAGNQNGQWALESSPGNFNIDDYTHDISAGHGPHCEAPMGNADPNLNVHPLKNDRQVDRLTYVRDWAPHQFYICNNHMMTVSLSGFDASFFMPRYLMDWSGGRTATLQFDTNPYSFARSYWSAYIAPENELLMSLNFSKRAVTFENWSNHFRIFHINNYDQAYRHDGPSYCDGTGDPACGDPRIRRTHKITINTTGWTMAIKKPDGTWFEDHANWDAPLDFTSGVILMTHYSYNPTKDEGHTDFLNPSKITYHWANFMIDGPAHALMTGYVPNPNPQLINTQTYIPAGSNWPRGKNPTDPIHFNITNSDLRNPRIWGTLDGMGDCGQGGTVCPDKTRTDPEDTTHWAQVSVNGGPPLDMPSLRPRLQANGTPVPFHPYVDSTDETWMTKIPANYPNPLHQGDNTLVFTHSADYEGYHIPYVEIQVDPNSDLPPANSGGTGGVEIPGATNPPAATPTPTQSGGSTATPTPTPTATPVPTPTSTPPSGSVTVDFNSRAPGVLNGEYPTGIINWGTNVWLGSGPFSVFTTNSVAFNGAGINSGTFSFVGARRLVSLQAANGGTVASTVTIACSGNPTVTMSVPINQLTTITTNWTNNCTGPVTITSSNGWNTNFDNLVVSSGGTGGTPTPSPTPIADIAFGGRVYIDSNNNGTFDSGESGVANRPINVNGTLFCTTLTDGTCTRFGAVNVGQTYTVAHTPATGFTNTSPTSLSVVAGQGAQSGTQLVNFGIRQTSTPTPTPTPTGAPIPGDIDGNRVVNIFDYNILVGNFGRTGSGIQGDLDNNGVVNIFDYNILVGNFGRTS